MHLFHILSHLLGVDLIKCLKCQSVCPSVHLSLHFCLYVRPSVHKTFFRFQVIALEKSEIRPFSAAISSPIYNGGWQMTMAS